VTALVAVGFSMLLAGCSDGSAADADKPRVPNEPDYKGWFDGVSNYDRTIDLRGQSQVRITVGAEGNMGALAFGPAAVAVSPGTTVTWEWTGKGGGHNVVAQNGSFDSGPLVSEKGYTFEHTFDEPGVFPYVCAPHKSIGMRGAIFVALGEPGS
jgi:halocyanin-like protein